MFILIGGAATLAVLPVWNSAFAAGNTAIPPVGRSLAEDILNRDCVVTVDTRGEPKEQYPGSSNKIPGFVAPDTVEGTLIHLDLEWLVLLDGDEENWVPRNKVLLLRVSR